jgi:hypothetical protein
MGQTEKSGQASGKSALPSIADFVRGYRHVSNVPLAAYGHATHGKLNVRRALTPPANPRERADLRATSPAERCLTFWLDVMRADDPL